MLFSRFSSLRYFLLIPSLYSDTAMCPEIHVSGVFGPGGTSLAGGATHTSEQCAGTMRSFQTKCTQTGRKRAKSSPLSVHPRGCLRCTRCGWRATAVEVKDAPRKGYTQHCTTLQHTRLQRLSFTLHHALHCTSTSLQYAVIH